jgi:hypothetical protein
MSGTKDVNWRSFVGPQDNGRSIVPEPLGSIFYNPNSWFPPSNPQDYDDLFKCSNVSNLTAIGLTIPASREDSIDCVRGDNYSFQSCTIEGSVTIKGAIDGVKLYNCVLSGTVELGQYDNYWKFGRAPTKNVLLHCCCSPDGKPIRVKVWDADTPYVVSTNVKIIKIPKWIWLPYFLFRRLTNPKAV